MVSVVSWTGNKISPTMTNSETAVPTLRNLVAGGFVKGTAACEADVPGGETGCNIDKMHT